MNYGLSATVYRPHGGDCTAGGISAPENTPYGFIHVAGPTVRNGTEKLADCNAIAVPWYGSWKIVPATRVVNSIALLKKIAHPDCRDGDASAAWLRWAERVDLLAQLPDQETGGVGPMMGGNFAYSTDSRWRDAFGSGPLPIHDRIETAEQYRLLSMD